MTAPSTRVDSRPPRKAMIVGSPPTRSVSASFGYASESSLPTRAVAPMMQTKEELATALNPAIGYCAQTADPHHSS